MPVRSTGTRAFALCALLYTFCIGSAPAATAQLTDAARTTDITSTLEYAPGNLAPAQVLSGGAAFTAAPSPVHSAIATQWLKLNATAASRADGPWVLTFPKSVISGEGYIWEREDAGYRRFSIGSAVPFADRALPFLFVSLPIDRAALTTGKPVYMRIAYHTGAPIWLRVDPETSRISRGFALRLIQGIFFGVLLALGLAYLFAAITMRDRSASWFVAYVAALIANELVTTGLGSLYIWPRLGFDAFWPSAITSILSFGAFLGFARVFLQTRKAAPFWDRLLIGAFIAIAITQLADRAFAGRFDLAPVALAVQLAGMLAMMGAGIVRMREGYHPAQFFVPAFLPALLGISANLFYDSFTPSAYSFVAQNGVEIGATLQVIILSFSLLDRIRRLDVERKSTRAELARTERRNIELRTLATRDPLTGLYNRLAFFEHFEDELQAARHSSLLHGVLYLDLDGFKAINDFHGHRVGDILLQIFARRLERAVRPSDMVARLGGDEFAVLVTGVSSTSVLESVRENVLRILDKPITIESKRIPVGMSVGLAIYPRDGDESDRLIEAADRQMYAAKVLRTKASPAEQSSTPV